MLLHALLVGAAVALPLSEALGALIRTVFTYLTHRGESQ